MPAGRPTLYRPEYCEDLVEHMAKGFSFESFAGIVGVCDDTLRAWEAAHPEFSAAKKIAFARNRFFWEAKSIEHLVDNTEYDGNGKPIFKSSLNTSNWIFNMKNRFKWTDKQDVQIQGELNTTSTTFTSAEEAREYFKNRDLKNK